MKYRQVKYIRRTPVELKMFREAVKDLTTQGYPVDIAESKAWDCLHAVRIGKRNKELK